MPSRSGCLPAKSAPRGFSTVRFRSSLLLHAILFTFFVAHTIYTSILGSNIGAIAYRPLLGLTPFLPFQSNHAHPLLIELGCLGLIVAQHLFKLPSTGHPSQHRTSPGHEEHNHQPDACPAAARLRTVQRHIPGFSATWSRKYNLDLNKGDLDLLTKQGRIELK